MVARRESVSKPPETRLPPATTPEIREIQMISLAEDLAERQMRDGTASAQVISHYLKLGSTREKLEQQRLTNEVALLETKREEIESRKRLEDLYQDAIQAFTEYSGHGPAPSEEFDED